MSFAEDRSRTVEDSAIDRLVGGELADTERLRETRRRDERREARREPLLGRRGDRQQVGVSPDGERAGRDRLAADGAALLVTVVDRVEGAEAMAAYPDGV